MPRHRSSTTFTSGLTDRLPEGAPTLGGLYFLSSASTFLWAYMPSQMSALGWTGTQIGIFFTITTVSQAVATPAWARLADRPERSRRRLLKLQYLLAALAIAALPLFGTWALGLAIATLLGATIQCARPLMDTVTLGTVGLNRFGHVRAFGTVGFGFVALLFGVLGVQLDRDVLASGAPWVMFGLLALAVPLTDYLPARGRPRDSGSTPPGAARPHGGLPLKSLLKSPVVVLVFPVAALFAATYVPYDLFLVSLADQRGFGAWLPGVALAVGVVGELVGFVSFRDLAGRLAPEPVILAVVATTGLVWLATGMTTSPWLFAGLQLINGLAFAAFFMAMLDVMTRHWGFELGATPHGLLYLLVFTLGYGVGTLGAGFGYEFGSAALLFRTAGLVALGLVPLLGLTLWIAHRRLPDQGPCAPCAAGEHD